MPAEFHAYIAPLIRDAVYSEYIDVTAYVQSGGVGELIEQVDDGDFDVGVFTNSGLVINMINQDGRFSDSNSPLSIFPHVRDLARVKLVFFDGDTEILSFNGLIDDTLTKEDVTGSAVQFFVIERSGIFGKINVTGGAVADGNTVTQALKNLLSRPSVTNYLNYSSDNINVLLDVAIDSGAAFDGKNYKEALDMLMLISGSVLTVDASGAIIVRSRAHNDNVPHSFYGGGDSGGQANIIRLAEYNNGWHRAFNLFSVDKTSAKNQELIDSLSLRKKELPIKEIIKDQSKQAIICNSYLHNFQYPKRELQIQVQSIDAKNVALFDLASISMTGLLKQSDGNPLPLYGLARYGEEKYPVNIGAVEVSSAIGFKVIGRSIDVERKITTLKLREIGTGSGDSNIIPVLVDERGSYFTDENYNFLRDIL